MRKRSIAFIAAAALMAFTVTGCGCKHGNMKAADCTSPETCADCGEVFGDPLEHQWKEASCKAPKTCEKCGATEGEPLEHKWKDADCEHPNTCELCGEEVGKPLGHDWDDASCTSPKKCSRCGKKDAEKADHKWKAADCENPKTCTVCGKTEGEPKGHVWQLGTTPSCTVCGKEKPLQTDLVYGGQMKVATANSDLNMREKPSTDSKILARIPNGTLLEVFKTRDAKWYYTFFGNFEGYVSAEFLQPVGNHIMETDSSGAAVTTKPNGQSGGAVTTSGGSTSPAFDYAAENQRHEQKIAELNEYYSFLIELEESDMLSWQNDSDYDPRMVGGNASYYESEIASMRKELSLYERDTSGAHKADIARLKREISEMEDALRLIKSSQLIQQKIDSCQMRISSLNDEWRAAISEENSYHQSILNSAR